MQSTSRARFTFERHHLTMTGVTVFPFPVVDRALDWYEAFAPDHDAEFLLLEVSHGFSNQFTDPNPGGEYYSVPNCVPAEHAHRGMHGSNLRRLRVGTSQWTELSRAERRH